MQISFPRMPVSRSFSDVETFRDYVLSTKQAMVRSIFFTVDFDSGVVRLVDTLPRCASTQEDVESLIAVLKQSNHASLWFVVRLDFHDSTDRNFCLGYCESAPAISSRALTFSSRLFAYARLHHYRSLQDLEDQVWNHLFPHYVDELRYNNVYDVSAVLVDHCDSSSPSFRLVQQVTPQFVSDCCRQNRCAFLLRVLDRKIEICFFSPEGATCACGRSGSKIESKKEKTVCAFMKADLVSWLQQIVGNQMLFSFTTDLHCCTDLLPLIAPERPDVPRRRSNEDVLSPPTLEKYNKGSSKRTRNFPDEQQVAPQSLFSN